MVVKIVERGTVDEGPNIRRDEDVEVFKLFYVAVETATDFTEFLETLRSEMDLIGIRRVAAEETEFQAQDVFGEEAFASFGASDALTVSFFLFVAGSFGMELFDEFK